MNDKPLCWVILDRDTGEFILRCDSRQHARSLCPREGIIAKVVVCR